MKDFSEKARLNSLLVTQPYERLRYISKAVCLIYCGWTVGSETLFFESRLFFSMLHSKLGVFQLKIHDTD